MASVNLNVVLKRLHEVDLDHPSTTFADVRAATAPVGKFNNGVVSITRMNGQSPWERHAKRRRALLCPLRAHQLHALSKSGRRTVAVPKGGAFIIPRNIWHR
jgi:hypothetical protein